MKLTKIVLKDYNQFKDVEIDLTYPKGHRKEGQPLDKVCIIGQSGSGKTSLLRLIKWFISLQREIGKNTELPLPENSNSVQIDFRFFDLNYRVSNVDQEPFLDHKWFSGENREAFFQKLKDYYQEIKPLLYNFPTEILIKDTPPVIGERSTLDELERIKEKKAYLDKLELGHTIDFSADDEWQLQTWDYVLRNIFEHRAEELYKKKEIADIELQNIKKEEKSKLKKEKTEEYKRWAKQNPDPLKKLADECLDPLLLSLGLRTKIEIDLNTILNLRFIQLQTAAGRDVPREFWSTGTRQLVKTVIPLYMLNPKNAVVLVDEPELSLYPDMQKSIIDMYVKLAPESQFFFATHSPIIASSFEPWEIVELKFDEEQAYVSRDLHYEGENHVDNYKYFPEYLRWDSILERIFELEEEGGKKRQQALEKLAEVEIRLRKLKKEKKLDSPEGKKLVEEFKNLGQKVDWDFE